MLVVTLEKAALWTDSRYWDQAKRELEGSTISLMRDGDPATASVVDWMLENLFERRYSRHRCGEHYGLCVRST